MHTGVVSVLLLSLLEAVTRDVLCKKVFLEISQNSQKTPVPEPLSQEGRKKLWHMNFAKFLRKAFLQNTSGRLFLIFIYFSLITVDKLCYL